MPGTINQTFSVYFFLQTVKLRSHGPLGLAQVEVGHSLARLTGAEYSSALLFVVVVVVVGFLGGLF